MVNWMSSKLLTSEVSDFPTLIFSDFFDFVIGWSAQRSPEKKVKKRRKGPPARSRASEEPLDFCFLIFSEFCLHGGGRGGALSRR